MNIKEIIELGGVVELTAPLMIFISAEADMYQVVWLREKSIVKIEHAQENAIYGIVTSTENPFTLDGDEVCKSDLKDEKFITTLVDLEKAIYVPINERKK